MISGNRPVQAMAYICDLQLFFVVFTSPDKLQGIIEGCDRFDLCRSNSSPFFHVQKSESY